MTVKIKFNTECDCGYKTGWFDNKEESLSFWLRHRAKLANSKAFKSRFSHSKAIINFIGKESLSSSDLENFWFGGIDG